MVNVANRAYVYVGFLTLKFFLRHRMPPTLFIFQTIQQLLLIQESICCRRTGTNRRDPVNTNPALANLSLPPGKRGGAHTQSRTGDLIITNDALYHLSYASLSQTSALNSCNPGAGSGNRTRMISLEGWSSTIELYPHNLHTLSA
jgi:hypothetical protein